MAEIQFFNNPDYDAHVAEWVKYKALYEGDESVLKGQAYLIGHRIESAPNGGAELRQIRENISTYTNLTEPAISKFVALFYKKPMDLQKAEAALGDYFYDVDGKGTGLETFIKWYITPAYLLFSRPIVFVDADSEKPKNQTEQVQKGLRFYMQMLDVLCVKDWQTQATRANGTGKLSFLRFEYKVLSPRTRASEEPYLIDYTRELYLDESNNYHVATYKKKTETNGTARWELVEDKQVDGWQELPIAAIFEGESWIKDSSKVQLRFYNHESERDMQLLAQSYDRIFISGELSDDQKKAWNSHVVNFIPADATVTVVPTADTTPIEKAISNDIDCFYKVQFNKERLLAADSKEAPGAEAQKEADSDKLALAVSALTELEDIVNEAITHAVHYMTGVVKPEKYVEFDKNLTVKDFDEMIPNITAFKDDIEHLPTMKKEILKKLARELELSDNKEVMSEIDSVDLQEAKNADLENQRKQIVGRFGG